VSVVWVILQSADADGAVSVGRLDFCVHMAKVRENEAVRFVLDTINR
jgi:hypothetical protein